MKIAEGLDCEALRASNPQHRLPAGDVPTAIAMRD
jgi:hypothetical protein